jgi:phospholipase/lecithinase/hemolysin
MWPWSSAAFADASAPAYTSLFAFGDSLSDAGNDYIVDGGTDPVEPYRNGHFSNGRTWVEDLSLKLGLGTLTPSFAGGHDFAFGGAETGPTNIEGASPGDLLGQVSQYALLHPTPVVGALYTLDIGGNDIIKALDLLRAGKITISDVGEAVAQAEANTVRAVEALSVLGARNLLFYQVPDLGLTPHLRLEGTAYQGLASGLAQSFNQTVLSKLEGLGPQRLRPAHVCRPGRGRKQSFLFRLPLRHHLHQRHRPGLDRKFHQPAFWVAGPGSEPLSVL